MRASRGRLDGHSYSTIDTAILGLHNRLDNVYTITYFITEMIANEQTHTITYIRTLIKASFIKSVHEIGLLRIEH